MQWPRTSIAKDKRLSGAPILCMQISQLSASLLLAAGLLFNTTAHASTAEPLDDAVYALALQEVLASPLPVEAYVAPPSLFPPEGNWRISRGLVKEPYAPLEAYDRIEGGVIGSVMLAQQHCLDGVARAVGAGCEGAGQVFLKTRDGRQRVVPVEMWAEDTKGLVARKPAVVKGAHAWSEIAYTGGTFWVRTAVADVHAYESEVAFVESVETWCVAPGKCAPASPAMLAALKALDGHFVNPAGAPFEVAERVVLKGTAYYRVKLSEIEGGWPKLGLPATGFIPTRDKAGKHTGTILPMGC